MANNVSRIRKKIMGASVKGIENPTQFNRREFMDFAVSAAIFIYLNAAVIVTSAKINEFRFIR